MRRLLVLLVVAAGWQASRDARALFYDPGHPHRAAGQLKDRGSEKGQPAALRNTGIHVWLSGSDGRAHPVTDALPSGGFFRLHVRDNVPGGGYLTIWQVEDRRELTPRSDPRWSGHAMDGREFVLRVPISISSGSPRRLVVVWTLSQTELPRSVDEVAVRLQTILGSQHIAQQNEWVAAGEIGTYVVNRDGGPVAIELIARPQ